MPDPNETQKSDEDIFADAPEVPGPSQSDVEARMAELEAAAAPPEEAKISPDEHGQGAVDPALAVPFMDTPPVPPEIEDEPEAEKPTVLEARKRVHEASKVVEKATVALGDANDEYRAACKAQVELNAKPTLRELNEIQKRVTKTEDRRKARAMKALGELGFGDPPRKHHPPLFKTDQ